MFNECRTILLQCLKDVGMKFLYTSSKKLKLCNEVRVGAVLFEDEQLQIDGSKRIYIDTTKKKRRKKFSRDITFNVVIGERDIEKVQELYDQFLERLPVGTYVNGNYVSMEPKQADWLDEEDSILKSKCAVQLQVICSGGIYVDSEFRKLTDVEIEINAMKGEQYGNS